ncbi:MAG: sigma 54-interacting transcriptional regulator [Desulfomicrobium sp.]|nr:sigma 54-interacting transcriptional regulator [Desulfomicrobium sp.]
MQSSFYDYHKRISEISARMVKASKEELDDEIQRSLKEALQPLGVDRGGLLQVFEDSPVVHIAYAWYDDGFEPVSKEINLAERYPWAYQLIVVQGKTWAMSRIEDLPPEADVDLRSYRLLGSKSVLSIPLFLGRKISYILTVNALKEERDWPEDIVVHLRLLGEIFVSALQRRVDDYALLEAKERLSLAVESAGAGLLDLDLESGVNWTTDRAREILGLDSGLSVKFENTLKLIHPDDKAMFQKVMGEVISKKGQGSIEYRIVLPNGQIRWLRRWVRYHEGFPAGRPRLLGITLDVTERKQMELQLRAQLQEIERLHGQLEEENSYLRNEVMSFRERKNLHNFGERMQEVLVKVEQVASTECTVLIEGETGTGKEVLANAIHQSSPRSHRMMITVNCAALPAALVESELFGREKGAFTGALSRQVGRFELAHGSTLFLDEIGEMPLETQAKLLRVLQEGEFERLGSPKTIKVDVRVLAASNRDLAVEVSQGRFRRDLYYRLNVFPILMPPLRERREDIPQLVWEFISEFGDRMGKKIRRIAKNDMERLKVHAWPGNIRELRNVIEHAMIVTKGDTLELAHLLVNAPQDEPVVTLEEMERQHIQRILKVAGNRVRGVGGAAELLAINPSTLNSRMRKLGIKSRPS